MEWFRIQVFRGDGSENEKKTKKIADRFMKFDTILEASAEARKMYKVNDANYDYVSVSAGIKHPDRYKQMEC